MFFKIIYNLSVRLYVFLIIIASFFNKKAKLWFVGRKKIFQKLEKNNFDNPFWFHVASLGEFEQARPLIEKIKHLNPQQQIILTFFSPSGYEIRKNYKYADFIYYLPVDTRQNAKKFIAITAPKIVFFVKYDFWVNYLAQIHKQNIPLYLVSGIFRENQIFFKSIGKKYSEVLTYFTHLFLQDQKSIDLLKTINITNVTLAGDTRFDRVAEIATQAKSIDVAEKFVGENFCLVAGSTWLPDEKILAEYINTTDLPIKFIIAPHQISQNRISELNELLHKKTIKYSDATDKDLSTYSVLIIDNIGMLSSLYRYGSVAYVGGGFGVGIHNILEAAVFGMPVIFGANYQKFNEAKQLIKLNAAFPVNNYIDFCELLDNFFTKKTILNTASLKASDYVADNTGSSMIILSKIKILN